MKLQQFGSSLSLPDRVLTFIRDHPLMDRPAEGHPLLVTTDTAYLRVVAHRVTSLSGKEYDVLYLGTGIFQSQTSCPYSTYSYHRKDT
jgi:plexin B